MTRFRLRLQDREITLSQPGELSVGRDASVADLALDDRLVSRRHAVFRCHEDYTLEIVDLDSLNGVRVNDVLVKGTRSLGHRDRVQIGAHVFLVIDQKRERRSTAPTTRSAPRLGAVRPTTRTTRGIVTPLDTIDQALLARDYAAASAAMDAIVERYADPSEALLPGELGRVVELLLALASETREARFFERIFQIHTGRRLVIDGQSIDVIQDALSRMPPLTPRAIDTYLESMRARAATLTAQEQVRLRRIATLSRRVSGSEGA